MSVCSTSLKVNSQHRVPEDNGERRKLFPWHQHFQFSGLPTCHMDHWRHSSDGLPAISMVSQIRMRHTQVPVLIFLQLCLSSHCNNANVQVKMQITRRRSNQVFQLCARDLHSFGCCLSSTFPLSLSFDWRISVITSPVICTSIREIFFLVEAISCWYPGAQRSEILSEIHVFFCLPPEDLVSSSDSGTFPHVPAHCW